MCVCERERVCVCVCVCVCVSVCPSVCLSVSVRLYVRVYVRVGLFFRFHNPLKSDMGYWIFNVRKHSLAAHLALLATCDVHFR